MWVSRSIPHCDSKANAVVTIAANPHAAFVDQTSRGRTCPARCSKGREKARDDVFPKISWNTTPYRLVCAAVPTLPLSGRSVVSLAGSVAGAAVDMTGTVASTSVTNSGAVIRTVPPD